MVFGDRQRAAVRRWSQAVLFRGGCYFSAVLSSSLLCIPPLPVALWFSDIFGARPVSDIIFSLYSDAYAVSATGGGLGGYAHGLYWHLPLSIDDVALLHITAWEFVALALNVVIFGPRVVGSAVNLYSDAMATVQVMLRQAAFSPDMQLIHSLLVSLPEFQALGINVFSDHVYGRINVLGDAASRALFELVHRVTAQLGVAAHRLVVPPRALDFVDEVRRRVAARVAVEDTALVPATPRPQSLAERQRMHHLGLSHLNSTSREFRFRFPSRCGLDGRRDRLVDFGRPRPSTSPLMGLKTGSLSMDSVRPESPPFWPSSALGKPCLDGKILVVAARPESPLFWPASVGKRSREKCMDVPAEPDEKCLDVLAEPGSLQLRGCRLGLARAFGQQVVEPESPPFWPGLSPFPRLDGLSPHISRAELAPPRPRYCGPMGRLPPIPPSVVLVEDVLTGKARTSGLNPVFFDALFKDDSNQALRPRDPTTLLAFAEAAQHGLQSSAPASTDAKNRTGWGLWTRFMREVGGDSPPLRRADPEHLLREQLLKNMFILWCRTKCTSSIPGRITCKPESLLGHLYAVKREHDKLAQPFLTKGQTFQLAKTLGREYLLTHGPEALAPRKREALTPQMVKALIQAVDGLVCNMQACRSLLPGSWLARNVKGALALAGCGGFRLAEIALVDGTAFSSLKMSRASLFFIVDGVPKRSPTRAELLSMVPGRDRIGVLACAAKNDPLVIHFLPFPIIVGFNPLDSNDAGLILRDLALHCPVQAKDLRSTPLFTYGRGGHALGYEFLRKILKLLLLKLFSAAVAALYTWHSFRSGLACALRAAKAPDWVLLALLRWRSKKSIPGYGRLSFEDASSWLDQAAGQNGKTLTTAGLPGIAPLAEDVVPNILPSSSYEFLEKARSLHIGQVELQAHHERLPQYDDDQFMIELAALPDQDGVEEAKVAGTW